MSAIDRIIDSIVRRLGPALPDARPQAFASVDPEGVMTIATAGGAAHLEVMHALGGLHTKADVDARAVSDLRAEVAALSKQVGELWQRVVEGQDVLRAVRIEISKLGRPELDTDKLVQRIEDAVRDQVEADETTQAKADRERLTCALRGLKDEDLAKVSLEALRQAAALLGVGGAS